MVVRLEGNIVCKKNCQLVINLTKEDAENFNIKEGDKVMVEWKELGIKYEVGIDYLCGVDLTEN